MKQITRRRIVIISLLGIVLLVFIFLFNNSLLIISSSSTEEKTVYVKNGGSTQNFTLSSGSKTLLLPRGSYGIEVVGQDMSSYYQKSLGFFWKNKVAVELKPQVAESYLGASDLPCAKNKAGAVLYYSCNPASFGLIESDGIKRLVEDQEEEQLELTSVLKPYKGAFIKAEAENGTLRISQLDENGLSTGSPATVNFGGEALDTTISVSPGGLIAAYDGSSHSVLVFKDAADKNPASVKLPGEKPDEELGFNPTVLATNSFVYLVEVSNGSELDNHEGQASQDTGKQKPKIIAVSGSDHEITEQNLPDEWVATSLVAAPEKDIMLILAGSQQGQVYKYNTDSGLETVPAVKDTVQTVCWADGNTFFYRADASKSLYRYSVEAAASYLVYNDPVNFIEEINCSDGQLYFSVSNDKILEVGDLLHYKLTNRPFSGARLGTVLPLYLTFDGDTLLIHESSGGVDVDLDYDSQGNGPPNKNKAKQEVLGTLNESEVNTDNLDVTINF